MQQKLLINFYFYPGESFLNGAGYFEIAERLLKWNTVLIDLSLHELMKIQ